MPFTRAALVAGTAALASLGGSLAETRAATAGWSRDDLAPVTQPAAVGDRLVLLAVRDGGLVAVGLDARTGKTLWSDEAAVSAVVPGQPPYFVVVDGAVIYPGRVSAQVAELVARDVRTGREIWRRGRGVYSSWPSLCPDERRAVCLTGRLITSRREGELLRFDTRTGERLHGAFIAPTGGRFLAAGLLDAGTRDPEVLVATARGRVAWRRALSAIFSFPGASTDWGWNFDRVPRARLYVGSPGWPPVTQSQEETVVDLSRAMTAGFRIRDGAAAWRNRGTIYYCNYLPCPGGRAEQFSSPAFDSAGGPTVGVRLRARGTVRAAQGGSVPRASAGARATLEGFDPATGKTRWSFDAGRNVGLITQADLPPQLARHTVVLRRGTREPQAIDLVDGSSRRVSPRAWAWCRRLRIYELSEASGASANTSFVGQDAVFPCRADGGRRELPRRAPAFMGSIGARAAGLIAWSDSGAVRALPAIAR